MVSSRLQLSALAGVFALTLAGCGSSGSDESQASAEGSGSTIEVEDNNGTQTVASPPESVVANDNRTFETLDTWGVELSAGAVSLMPDDLSYTEDDSILDLGSHREPDLEKVVERSEERRVGKEWRAAWRVSLPKRRRSFGRTE